MMKPEVSIGPKTQPRRTALWSTQFKSHQTHTLFSKISRHLNFRYQEGKDWFIHALISILLLSSHQLQLEKRFVV